MTSPLQEIDRQKWLDISKQHFARIIPSYDAGRAFERSLFWAKELQAHVTLGPGDRLLDVGCGTGLFTTAFASSLPGPVIGIDPSPVMLSQAIRRNGHASVQWMLGQAEKLPFHEQGFQAIFLSQVWHHLEDDRSAAIEFRRILRPGGVLFIKTFAPEQILGRWLLQAVFPELLPLMLTIYPSSDQIADLLKYCGFEEVCFQHYWKENLVRPSKLIEFVNENVWSMFSFLTPEGRQAGLSILEQLAAETGDEPVSDPEVHLLVVAQN
jgi:ubiquinone/menaquinone biosynthesis C-methylase UbiE